MIKSKQIALGNVQDSVFPVGVKDSGSGYAGLWCAL